MEVQTAENPTAQNNPASGQEPQKAGSEPQGQEPKGQQAEGKGTGDSGNQLDYSDPEATKAVIESLRKENAKLRTGSKERDSEYQQMQERFSKLEKGLKTLFGQEEEEMTPEERLNHVQAQNEHLQMAVAMKEAAFEYGIGTDQYEYFEYLVTKAVNGLEEGQELTDEDLEGIAKQAKGVGAARSTSVDGQGQGSEPTVGNPDELSLEEFQEMGIVAKSQLYSKNPKLYEKLKLQDDAARKKR